MALIPYNELSTLIDASEAKSVATNAEKDAQLASIAHEINTAANTGSFSITVSHILDDVKKTLESKGYKVEKDIHFEGDIFTISWR